MSLRGLIAGLGALAVLAACQPEAPKPAGAVLSDAERLACLAAGGTVGRGGLLPDEVCFRPTADGGKSCTTARDCEGPCMAETMTCAKVTPQFGCFGLIMEDGTRADLCVD